MKALTYSPCSACRKLNRVPTQSAGQPVCGLCKTTLPLHGSINNVSASELMLLAEKSPLPVVVDFWAPWCQPCKVFAPSFEQAAQAMAGELVFAKLNTQEHPLANQTYGIRGIPTLLLFQDNREQARISGAMPYPQFLAWLREKLPAQAA